MLSPRPPIFGPQISSGVNWPQAKRGQKAPSCPASEARRRPRPAPALPVTP